MERYCLVRFRAGRGLASDMGLKFKVTDTQGDTVELHHDRLGYRFADRSKLEPWVDGATWDGAKYVDPVQPDEWVRPVDHVYAADPDAPTTVLIDRDTVTLRDRFAMVGLRVALDFIVDPRCPEAELPERRKNVAEACYEWADAMLAARSRTPSDVTG